MAMNRREFIASLGGAGLFYAFRMKSPDETGLVGHDNPYDDISDSMPFDPGDPACTAFFSDADYRDWVVFAPDGTVTVFTGRTELGQGLKTVITALVTQALEITIDKLTVVMGDTDTCTDVGSTAGSSSTRAVGWSFWLACLEIRGDLVARAAQYLRMPPEELVYKKGGIGRKDEQNLLVSPAELGSGSMVKIDLRPGGSPRSLEAAAGKQYEDRGILNVNAEAIVTGTLKYVGDVKEPGMLYAAWQIAPYHPTLTRLQAAECQQARALPGIRFVDVVYGRVAAVGGRYNDVLKALELVETSWSQPTNKKELPLEDCRQGAELLRVNERQGNVENALAGSYKTLSETYTTSYLAQAAIETDTAVAITHGRNSLVWASSQWPHKHRELTARFLKAPLQNVHILGMPVGGGFGGKQANPVVWEAAQLSRIVKAPVKLVYSRKDQFQSRSLFKAACIIDVTTGVDNQGKMTARQVDVFQDIGEGTSITYAIPNVLARAYRDNKWPIGMGVSRGTSFVQTCFATESHVDMVAHKIGMDPLEFRRKNVYFPFFVHLLDICAEKIGYGTTSLEEDEAIGLAIISHGPQFGAIAARVKVYRASGRVKVRQICGAFDIGTVININTVTLGVRGAITWGIGYALSEQVKLDGHSVETEYLAQYGVPRFSDVPPIDITFINEHTPTQGPRGCGEMPAIPTICAIANAIYKATGVRMYSIPITPAKLKAALGAR